MKDLIATLETMSLAYDSAFEAMMQGKDLLFLAQKNHLETKNELEKKKKLGLANGTITGSNADKREAAAMEILSELYEKAESCEDAYKDARHQFEMASLRVDQLKFELRLIEAAVKLIDGN